ncbi:MAG: hydroxymethylglutaryl-CoA lyase [Pseudomonadota bacterium]
MTEHVTIFEMGPRDGLQNEARMISTGDKIRLVNLLSECGFSKIETASFVSPKWVPQMADSAEVLAGIARKPGVAYTSICPNMKGYERARDAGSDGIGVFGSASEGFSRSNVNCSLEEALERALPIVAQAKADGIDVRGYVSCAVKCPFDGDIDPKVAAMVAKVLYEAGCYEVSLGDTIGQGTPETITTMLDAVLKVVPAEALAGHYHDTNGRALENISVSLDKGLRVFDSSVGGLGGCPYAPGAEGNVATEGVVELAAAKGFDTGIDAGKLAEVVTFARTLRSDAGEAA